MSIRTYISRAVESGSLREPFRAAAALNALREYGLDYSRQSVAWVLARHRVGNPFGEPEFFERVSRGLYRTAEGASSETIVANVPAMPAVTERPQHRNGVAPDRSLSPSAAAATHRFRRSIHLRVPRIRREEKARVDLDLRRPQGGRQHDARRRRGERAAGVRVLLQRRQRRVLQQRVRDPGPRSRLLSRVRSRSASSSPC